MPSWSDYLKQLEAEEAANPQPAAPAAAAPKRTIVRKPIGAAKKAAAVLSPEEEEKRRCVFCSKSEHNIRSPVVTGLMNFMLD
jgi:hypothetical protein